MKNDMKKKLIFYKMFIRNRAFYLFMILYIALMTYLTWTTSGKLYINKAIVKDSIQKLIKNNADLDLIKHHYKDSKAEKWNIIRFWEKSIHDYYDSEVALSVILNDLRRDIYLSDTPDENLDKTIMRLINEYEERNPFEGLENVQKDYFENIRFKLGAEYSKINIDLSKISDELINKNNLVNKYLSDSKTSLYISIVSIGFALIMAAFQLYVYAKENKKEDES